MLDCIEDAEKITGNKDQRNILAHLQYVTDEDIQRMAATGSVPAVPPLWTGKVSGNYEQSLRAMTINVARQFHQEHRMGSIEFGKIANMTVYDCDFLNDDIEKVAQASIIATIIDGEEVYRK